MSRVFNPEGLVVGILLIVLGVLWTLSNLGRIDLLSTLRTWWPAAFVFWGAVELANALLKRGPSLREDKRSSGGEP